MMLAPNVFQYLQVINKNQYEFIWKDLNEIKSVHIANNTISIYQNKSLFDNKLNELKGLKYFDQLNKEVM